MTKKDILELKRRLKKNECTFTKMCGCYVDGNKNIILNINETFLNLEDDEFYKYLEIAKKVLSGTLGNNILELEFSATDEDMSMQKYLYGLKDSKLKNEALLQRLYEQIIKNYDYAGNYLILIFHDAYDVTTRSSDNSKLDESEEVYEYILCAVCPVELTEAGLGYREDENRIGVRNRDWVVEMPETGFVFPAFTDRSSDIHSIMYYTKNAKKPHSEFMEDILNCIPKRTIAEEKEIFNSIIKDSIEQKDEKDDIYIEIQKNLNSVAEEMVSFTALDDDALVLTNEKIHKVVSESNIPENVKEKIEKLYESEFTQAPPLFKNLIDEKAIAENEQKEKTKELQKQVQSLKSELEEINSEKNIHSAIILNCPEEKAAKIRPQIIDGQKYIIVPVDDGETANINGVDIDFL